MKTLLIRNARCVATFDHADPAQARELRDASVLVRGNRIEAIGPASALPQSADQVIDARGHLVIPGLVNTHHHMFQSLTRAIPAVQDVELFSWLRGLYPIWARLRPEMLRVSTKVAVAELLQGGCTTSSDHLYIYPNGVRLDDSIEAATELGMRFIACRGSMSMGQSKGGLSTDACGKTVYGCDVGPAEMGARDVLVMATRGGAQVLGRSDIGHLAVGMCADLALFDLDTVAFAGGAVHDPVAALVFCASPQAAWVVVNGRVVVQEGHLLTAQTELLSRQQTAHAQQLMSGRGG